MRVLLKKYRHPHAYLLEECGVVRHWRVECCRVSRTVLPRNGAQQSGAISHRGRDWPHAICGRRVCDQPSPAEPVMR